LKDIKINLLNALNYPSLGKKDATLIALSVAVNEKNQKLTEIFTNLAKNEGSTEEEIADIYACTSLLRMNNVFYRFRHFVGKDFYSTSPAGLKMSAMGKPVISKELFELISLCVSALNGCEVCVKSHEQSVLQHGCTEIRIYEAIKLTSIIKSLDIF
jgi:alkyl hydroperoxide reductase subunit D